MKNERNTNKLNMLTQQIRKKKNKKGVDKQKAETAQR